MRRRAGPWTPAVHALLNHLRGVGFHGAPEPLGMDERGRAVLRFMEGEVHQGWPDPMPPWMYEDEDTLIRAADLLRHYHASLATFVAPPNARWRMVTPDPHEVICHNDWAPYNALFDGHRPIAMLDWDSAGPGSRAWDVATSVYTWVPLYPETNANHPAMPMRLRAARLATFCAAYGSVQPIDAVTTLVGQLGFSADFIHAEATSGDPGFAKLAAWDVPARLRRHAAVLRGQMDELLAR